MQLQISAHVSRVKREFTMLPTDVTVQQPHTHRLTPPHARTHTLYQLQACETRALSAVEKARGLRIRRPRR